MKEKLSVIKAEISSLEKTSEGQLRGGFAVIGGVSPLDDTNKDCANNKCNIGCGESNIGQCFNNGCNKGCPGTTTATSNNPGLTGMTFSF